MKGADLEVLLVSAKGLKHAHLPGSSYYYVVIQCGNHTFTSKITSEKDGKVCWNEKFRFMLSSAECKDLAKLKLRIMEKDKFLEDRPVGETMVYLRGILKEGREKGFLELKPSSYNVVLYDGTYEGELKIGLKFISDVELEQQTKSIACTVPQKQPYSLYQALLSINLRGIPWSRFFFFHNHSESRKGLTRIDRFEEFGSCKSYYSQLEQTNLNIYLQLSEGIA